jgi:drug/metabolite transporter (DMT)-like permease
MVAFHVVTASYYQKKYDLDPAIFIFVNIVVAGVFSIIFMAIGETIPKVSIIDFWPLLFLGILNTALGFLVQGYTLKYSLPTRVSLIVTLESVFSVVGAVLILEEILTINVVVGGFLIISAVLLSEIKPFRKHLKKT